MHLAFDILRGIGIGTALGIAPLLPALVVGALAAGNVEMNFKHTDYSFLQSAPFLLAIVVAAVALAIAERRFGRERFEHGPGLVASAVVGGGLAALFFAGELAHDHYAAWPGWIAGVICAGIAFAATRPLFGRVRARLDAEGSGAVSLYAEGIALLLAALSVVAPPVGAIGLLLMIWLLVADRRRGDKKYAGLRILR